MSALLTPLANAAGNADAIAARTSAARPDEGRGRATEPAGPVASASVAASGVHTRFSPQSLRALEDSALAIAGDMKDLVVGAGQAGVDLIGSAANAIDAVGEGASALVTAGADSLVEGISAVRSGVGEAADAVQDAVSDAAGRAGEAVESAVGYAALAALAGGALIDVLA